MMSYLADTGQETVAYSECIVNESGKAGSQPEDESEAMTIFDAFENMKLDEPGAFKTNGKPDAQYVSHLLAHDVDQVEVDKAWDEWIEAGSPAADEHLVDG